MPFYEKLGFTAYGETFMEADILHMPMVIDLETPWLLNFLNLMMTCFYSQFTASAQTVILIWNFHGTNFQLAIVVDEGKVVSGKGFIFKALSLMKNLSRKAQVRSSPAS